MKKPPFERKKQVTTPDRSYFQCYEGEPLSVVLQRDRRTCAPWGISVWGPDDIGVQCAFKDYDAAVEAYAKIQDGVTAVQLKGWGFERP